MSPIRFAFPLALVTAVSLSLTACGGGDQDDAAGQNTPAASTPAPSATAESPDASKTPAASVRRTSSELAKALLELADLPDGYQVEKDDPAGADKPFSSASSKCKTLVRFLNATEAPGAKATTHRSFSAGQEGTFVDFGIDAMGNEDEVAYLQHAYRKAVTSCPKVTMTIGAGRYSMKVEEISAPQFGTDPYAFRLTATSGSRRGLEFTAATTGVQDVLVSVTLLAGQEGELEGATEAAVAKAQQVLEKGA